MRDSYKIFFEHFGIQFEDVIRFGVNIDTIYPEPDKIQKVWKDLIDAVVNGKPVWIRGYGKDSHGTELYLELYRILLGNSKIKKDSTNNAKPTSVLQKVTGFTKPLASSRPMELLTIRLRISGVVLRTHFFLVLHGISCGNLKYWIRLPVMKLVENLLKPITWHS